jgi:tetratricopeptide (TPR) repeat protein
LSEVLQQLGRLLAGPLEDGEGAIAVYRQAIWLDPNRIEMHASLAEFLSYRAANWDEALAHHQWVLNADPCHVGSLRVLLRVARQRENQDAIATGLGIARALGIASPIDLEDAEALDTTPRYSGNRELSDPLWETLRKFINGAASEIAEALGVPESADEKDQEDPIIAFHAETLSAEARLTARGLLPLTNTELGELIVLVAAIVLDPERVRGDGNLVNALSSSIKRRQRRKLRNYLEDESMDSISSVDFAAWREGVRALASAIAIDDTEIDLRDALISLASDATDAEGAPAEDQAPCPDISAWAARSPEARALLRLAIRSWLGQL